MERRRELGSAGEREAERRLAGKGWAIVARNVRTRHGEIDLIGFDGPALCFVEVKTLAAGAIRGPERPALAVGVRKQLRIRRLAAAWLSENRPQRGFATIRFDVVGLRLDPLGRVTEYEHLRGAF